MPTASSATTTPRSPDGPFVYHVAHATRGRLRVRYSTAWLAPRRAGVEARLRALPGVRAIESRAVTGSIVVHYDPFALAEERLIEHLDRLHGRLDRGRARAPRAAAPRGATGIGAPLAQLLGAGAVLAS